MLDFLRKKKVIEEKKLIGGTKVSPKKVRDRVLLELEAKQENVIYDMNKVMQDILRRNTDVRIKRELTQMWKAGINYGRAKSGIKFSEGLK